MNKPPRIRAEFRDVRTDAGAIWWKRFIESEEAKIVERERMARVIYWEPAGNMPVDIFSYTREASRCFTVANFLATIILSSGVVEIIVNKDRRMRARRSQQPGWENLSNRTLRIAGEEGLPVHALVSDEEDLASGTSIRFVARRNEIAHGNIAHLIKELSGYDPVAEQEAFDQLRKSSQFLLDWFNSAPDVQESHIKNHRWGDI